MVIIADQEGVKVLRALVDVALKAGGFANLQQVNAIIASIKELPPQEKPKPETEGKGEVNLPSPKNNEKPKKDSKEC